MNITFHAGERFLQRVFKMSKYTKQQVLNAMTLLAKDLTKYHSPSDTYPFFSRKRR